jgi:hypothetical protein
MSGTFPLPNFTSVTIKSTAPTITTQAISGQRQAKQVAGQYWEIDAEMASLTRQEFAQVMGFMSLQRNSLYTFTIVIPVLSTATGDILKVAAANPGLSNTMVVASNVAAGGSTVAFDTAYNSNLFTGGSSASTGMRSGDFVKFSNHDKVYQLTGDVTFNSTGGGTMTIFPNLIDGVVGANTTIVYTDVPFTVYNKNATQEYSYAIGNENQITLNLQENI